VASPSPTIAVQKTRGKPKLEVVDGSGSGPAAAPGAPPVAPKPLPPPPAAAEPIFGPEGTPEVPRRPWTPDEAALAAAGAHNVGWTGAFFVRKELTQREMLEAAYADPKELDAAAPSIARVLDKTPLEPGGSGTLGLLGDILVTAQAVLGLEVRHASRVEEARQRLKKQGQQTGPRAGAPSPPPDRPRPPAPPGPPLEDDAGAMDDAAFSFSPDQLSLLNGGHP
jgi:hypothetical protein